MADETVKERFTISPIDGRGRAIASEVLAVANEIRRNALAYAEKAIGDPAVAASLFEEAAAAVSRLFLRSSKQKAGIRNLRGYLFRTYIRRVNRVRRKEGLLIARLIQQSSEAKESISSRQLELEILIDEIIARGEPVMRDMFRRRIEGYSWNEIGRAYRISAHAAESRFSQSLQRLRKKLQANRQQRGMR